MGGAFSFARGARFHLNFNFKIKIYDFSVGNSLPAITSPFLKTSFGEKNEWPISVQCTGASYTEKVEI